MKIQLNLLKLLPLYIFFLVASPLASVAQEETSETAIQEVAEPVQEEEGPVSMPELVGRVLIYLGLLGAIGYSILMFTRKGRLFNPGGKSTGTLQVTDTHMLGNKQFLVVVEYESEKILLAVGPGMIQKLSNLPSKKSSLEPEAT